MSPLKEIQRTSWEESAVICADLAVVVLTGVQVSWVMEQVQLDKVKSLENWLLIVPAGAGGDQNYGCMLQVK